MVHVPTLTDFEQVNVQYAELGDGSDPIALGTTVKSTNIQCSLIQFGTNK